MKVKYIILIFFIIAAIFLCLKNKQYLKLEYSNLRNNSFSVNDSVFLKRSALETGEFTGLPLFRLAKSNNKSFPYLVFAGVHIETNPLLKASSRYIGRYAGHEICHIEYKNISSLDNIYIIQVDPEVVKKDDNFKDDVNSGYTYVNNKYYIIPQYVNKKVE
jgi:hypothetical protein